MFSTSSQNHHTMPALPTGDYYLTIPILNERPIGAQDFRVVVQPRGTEAHKWHLERIGPEEYIITFKGEQAKPKDGHVILVPSMLPPPPPFVWNIRSVITAPPSPEPLYIISFPEHFVPNYWYINPDSPIAEFPVAIFRDETPICIFPAK